MTRRIRLYVNGAVKKLLVAEVDKGWLIRVEDTSKRYNVKTTEELVNLLSDMSYENHMTSDGDW